MSIPVSSSQGSFHLLVPNIRFSVIFPLANLSFGYDNVVEVFRNKLLVTKRFFGFTVLFCSSFTVREHECPFSGPETRLEKQKRHWKQVFENLS